MQKKENELIHASQPSTATWIQCHNRKWNDHSESIICSLHSTLQFIVTLVGCFLCWIVHLPVSSLSAFCYAVRRRICIILLLPYFVVPVCIVQPDKEAGPG